MQPHTHGFVFTTQDSPPLCAAKEPSKYKWGLVAGFWKMARQVKTSGLPREKKIKKWWALVVCQVDSMKMVEIQ